MDLILWRHADAVDHFSDLVRELSAKGKKQAGKMADWLAPQLADDATLIASGALRAQQTLAAVGRDFRIETKLNPGAHPQSYLQLASEGTTVIVGHQPEIGRAISLLLNGEDRAISVKKASLWWFVGQHGQWELRTMQSPDQLA